MTCGTHFQASNHSRLSEGSLPKKETRLRRRARKGVGCRPVLLSLALTSLFYVAVGCKKSPPLLETHRVAGTVQYNNGDFVTAGLIDFRSKRDQRLSMNAEIRNDGSFELATLHENQNYPGAVAGPCSVMVTIFVPGNPIPLILDLPQTYEVSPGDNEFAIKLTSPPPK